MAKPRVFISYSSKDREVAERIHQKFKTAGFDVWRDQTRLETDWSREIAEALADRDVLCLLWSEQSAQSKWVKHEWLTARALEKPIVICELPGAPKFPEPLHNIHGVKFKNTTTSIKELISHLEYESLPEAKYDYTILPKNSYIPFRPNRRFTGRKRDLLELYLKMIGNLNKIGVNQVGLVGMGGVGKTQLVVEFAYRFSFGFERIYWVQAADQQRWHFEFVALARDRLQLTITEPESPEANEQYIFRLQEYCREHPNTLIIIDNVVEPKLLNNDTLLFGLTPLSLGCDMLFTTRRHFQLPGVTEQKVETLLPEAAFTLLTSDRQPKTTEEQEHAQAICNAVGYLPLAIVLAAGYLGKYSDVSFADYREELIKNKLNVVDIGEISQEELATRHIAAVEVTLQSQWDMLEDENARHLFKLAGLFREAEIIPKARLGLLSGIVPGKSKLDRPLDKAYNLLHELNLVEELESDTHSIRLHPLVHDFAMRLIPEQEHASFKLTAAKFAKVAYFDFSRLESELTIRGIRQVLEDFQVAIDWWEKDGSQLQELKLLDGVLKQIAHILIQDPRQLAAQMVGRLVPETEPWVRGLLEQAKEWSGSPWIRPLRPSLRRQTSLLRVLEGNGTSVLAVAVTADGRQVISGYADGTVKVLDLETGRETYRLDHGAGVDAVAINQDGDLLVTASDKGSVRVWDLPNQKTMYSFQNNDLLSEITVSIDAKKVVWVRDNYLETWDTESKSNPVTLDLGPATKPGMKAWLLVVKRTLAVTPDARIAVLGNSDQTIGVWDIAQQRRIHLLSGHPGGWWADVDSRIREFLSYDVKAVAITADGDYAVSGADDRTIKVWDLKRGKEVRTLEGHQNAVTILATTINGKRVFSGSLDNTVRVWDLKTGKLLQTFIGHTSTITALATTPDEKRLISGSNNGELRIWDLETKPEQSSMEDYGDKVYAVAFTPDDRYLLSSSADNTLKIWDVTKCQPVSIGENSISGMSLSSVEESTTTPISSKGSRLAYTMIEPNPRQIRAIAVMPDGKAVICGFKAAQPLVWDFDTGQTVLELEGHPMKTTARVTQHTVHSVAVTGDGRRILTAPDRGGIKIWCGETGEELARLKGNHVGVIDDSLIVTADGLTLRLWDCEHFEEIAFKVLAETVNDDDLHGMWKKSVVSMAVRPNSQQVMCGLRHGIVKLFDFADLTEVWTVEAHREKVNVIAITPNGQHAITGSSDCSLKVWDLNTAICLATLSIENSVLSLDIASDGATVVAGDGSGRIHFLHLEALQSR